MNGFPIRLGDYGFDVQSMSYIDQLVFKAATELKVDIIEIIMNSLIAAKADTKYAKKSNRN